MSDMQASAEAYDQVIVGGGVIGLSLARELAARGARVAVVERGELGRQASWAGAGILPPANRQTAIHALDHLRGLSVQLHRQVAAELLEETGIDTGYRECGGLYLARSAGEAASLHGMMSAWLEEQIEVQRLDLSQVVAIEPALDALLQSGALRSCYWLPSESQLRNPRHLKALAASCRQRGVQLRDNCEVLGFEVRNDRLETVRTSQGPLKGNQVCICSGAWTKELLADLQIENSIVPVRGQMVMFAARPGVLTRIVNEGSRYLVPRDDGLVLAGSTEEEVGFAIETTSEGIEQLVHFACTIVPALKDAEVVRRWAGLRPGTVDGFPYLGRLPGLNNGYVAAGHFRSGLYLSPATAVVMAELLLGQTPCIDLAPFSVLRSAPNR